MNRIVTLNKVITVSLILAVIWILRLDILTGTKYSTYGCCRTTITTQDGGEHYHLFWERMRDGEPTYNYIKTVSRDKNSTMSRDEEMRFKVGKARRELDLRCEIEHPVYNYKVRWFSWD